MESKHPTQSSPDEIDLLDLLIKVVLVIKRNIAFSFVAFLVGSTLGLLYYQFSPNVYSSKMLISSDILTESYSKTIIDNLNKLIDEGNSQSLARKLNISEGLASKIEVVKITSALEKASDAAENTKTYLNIEVKSRDNAIWPQLQGALLGFFQNNEYVKIRIELKKKYNNQVIEKINLELTDLENLKKRISEGGLTQSGKENLVLFDPTTVNSKILDLNKEKINLQNSLETVNSVQVVEGFTVFNQPASPKLSKSLIGGASLGLFFVVISIVFKAIRALIKLSEESLTKS